MEPQQAVWPLDGSASHHEFASRPAANTNGTVILRKESERELEITTSRATLPCQIEVAHSPNLLNSCPVYRPSSFDLPSKPCDHLFNLCRDSTRIDAGGSCQYSRNRTDGNDFVRTQFLLAQKWLSYYYSKDRGFRSPFLTAGGGIGGDCVVERRLENGLQFSPCGKILCKIGASISPGRYLLVCPR